MPGSCQQAGVRNAVHFVIDVCLRSGTLFLIMKKTWLLLPCIALALGAGKGSMSDYPKPTDAELMGRIPANPTAHCKSKNGLPDSTCTPGKAWTTDTDTICHGGSTSLIRPPVDYTDKLKVAQITEYDYGDVDPSDYEEDHLISLELGGNPDDPANLWPEAHAGKNGSKQKDKVENWLHKQICSGAMTPKDAQEGISTNWKQYLSKVAPYKAKSVREVQ